MAEVLWGSTACPWFCTLLQIPFPFPHHTPGCNAGCVTHCQQWHSTLLAGYSSCVWWAWGQRAYLGDMVVLWRLLALMLIPGVLDSVPADTPNTPDPAWDPEFDTTTMIPWRYSCTCHPFHDHSAVLRTGDHGDWGWLVRNLVVLPTEVKPTWT